MKRVMTPSILPLMLAPVVVVIVLWLRSYWRLDVISYVNDAGATRAAASYQGAVHLISAGTYGRRRPLEWDAYRIPADSTYAALHRVGAVRWSGLGFARIQDTPMPLLGGAGKSGGLGLSQQPYGPSPALAPWLAATPFDALIVPYWAIALLVGAYPLERLRRRIRGMLRHRRGCCAACGYDLRASSGRCPECGADRRT